MKWELEAVSSCPLCGGVEQDAWSSTAVEVPAVRCPDCALVYNTRRLTLGAADAYYAAFNARRDADSTEMLARRRAMYELDRRFLAHFASPGPLLDYGCGSGEFVAGLGTHARRSGYDVDAHAVASARRRWPVVEFDTDLTTLAHRAGPFATVVFRGTLQYVRDLGAIQRTVTTLLDRDGLVVLLATPNSDAPLADLLRERWVLHNTLEHLVTFNLSSVARLFDGFDIEYVDFPYVGTPYEDRAEDLRRFVAVCKGDLSDTRFPFWGSMMSVVLRRRSRGRGAQGASARTTTPASARRSSTAATSPA